MLDISSKLNALIIKFNITNCGVDVKSNDLKSHLDDMFSAEFHRYVWIDENSNELEIHILCHDNAEELAFHIKSSLVHFSKFRDVQLTVDETNFVV